MDAECCGHAKISAVFCIYGSPNSALAASHHENLASEVWSPAELRVALTIA